MKAKEIASFTSDGCAMVKVGKELKRYKLFILPAGGIAGKPEVASVTPIDQLAERVKTPVAQRWAGVDQAS